MHLLTFDIEDWFHILDNAETADISEWISFPSRLEEGVGRILDFCDRIDTKATFFILGWVAETAPDIVSEIARRGHEIGCHSYRHQLVYQQTPQEFERDLDTALSRIEAASGKRCEIYRAPGFSMTKESLWAFDALIRYDIKTDCSIFPAARGHGGLPHFPVDTPCLLEDRNGNRLEIFPIGSKKIFNRRIIFSGGGYFRLLPCPIIRKWFRDDPYIMTYFHPRDFDPDQPMIPGLSFSRKFKSYVGLRSALRKLEAVAHITQFLSLEEARRQVDWSTLPVISLSQLEGNQH